MIADHLYGPKINKNQLSSPMFNNNKIIQNEYDVMCVKEIKEVDITNKASLLMDKSEGEYS